MKHTLSKTTYILIFFSSILFAQPLEYNARVNETPDLLQTDKEADLPGRGTQYCLPVSVSNSFAWLAKNGFENLLEKGIGRKKAQIKAAYMLGSSDYMNTSLRNGTGTKGCLIGVDKYIKQKGYEHKRLEYQGWRYHPKKYMTGIKTPQLKWIKEGIIGKSAVWLNIGWYKYNKSSDEYNRIGGHWVTLVGYGVDENGKKNENILIIHDPSPRAGRSFANEYVKIKKITSGTLTGRKWGLPQDASGYYIFEDGMHVKSIADLGIMDGAVVLKM